MKSCKVFIIIFTLMFFVVLGFPTRVVSVPTYTVGVEVGYWAKYMHACMQTSNNTDDVPQPEMPIWSNVTVESVSGTMVVLNEISYFENGTTVTDMFEGDIKSGTGDLVFKLIAKGLSEGDPIAEDATEAILSSKVDEYAGAFRRVNRYFHYAVDRSGNYTDYDVYWDKETGVLCELITAWRFVTEEYSLELLVVSAMSETNMWQPGSGFKGLEWVAIVTVVFVIVIVIYTLRRKTPSKRKSLRVSRRSSKLKKASHFYVPSYGTEEIKHA